MLATGTDPESQGYLWRARELVKGVGALMDRDAQASYAAQFLAAWAVELALKGYLASRGWSRQRLAKPAIRHNLVKLWQKATEEGLQIESVAPHWCVVLSDLHASPFYARYPVDDIHGHVLPSPKRTCAGLFDLFQKIEGSVDPQN